ncbi:MAG: NfeD family protein [Acholeplasmatales bacterium]|nr:NfeD family protein [Acholeplasmatales bacterium]
MNIEEYTIWIWLAIFVITIIVEAATQDLVSIWFSLGSLVALAISGFSAWWAEIIVFLVVSVIALILTRPIMKRLMQRNERKTNTDEFIGKKLKAISDISKYDAGEVKLNGIIYTAILMEDSYDTIAKDSIVEVVAIKGNRLVVKNTGGNE